MRIKKDETLKAPIWEDALRWVCKAPPFSVVFPLGLLILFLWSHRAAPSNTTPAATFTATASPAAATIPAATSAPSPQTTPSASPTPAPLEFTLVFIPVNWQSSQDAFERAAKRQGETFIRETGMDTLYKVRIESAPNGLENASLASSDLVYDVEAFALLNNLTGERYVGLTDGDLRPNGQSSVVGWTSGGKTMVAEYDEEYVVTHELGHTFGLCDEYNFADWSRQNESYRGGCPNDFPVDCAKDDANLCLGAPAPDGSNSIMGPAGLSGGYSFNEQSMRHLQALFSEARNKGETP